MRRLKNNDPNIDNIDVNFSPDDEDMFNASTVDWEKEGKAIAENTHIKKLGIVTDISYHDRMKLN